MTDHAHRASRRLTTLIAVYIVLALTFIVLSYQRRQQLLELERHLDAVEKAYREGCSGWVEPSRNTAQGDQA